MRTRAEHLQWCKDTAMQYVESGELVNAVMSMMSDMQKHDETKFDGGSALGMISLLAARDAQSGDRAAVVRCIKGFN